jgi:Zn-dependent M28 family amino/carboxypeptidase
MNTKTNNYNQTKKKIPLTLSIAILILCTQCTAKTPANFNSERAYQDLEYQVSLGPRTMGSQAHQEIRSYIKSELDAAHWEVEELEQSIDGKQIFNIVAKRNKKEAPWLLIGAHYDSRFFADHDPDPSLRKQPVPGANDGASGVAVLLELARILPKELDKSIWFVFFDAEDNGNIPGYDWIMGSKVFIQNLAEQPEQVIIIDMIGDSDLTIYKEKNSDAELTKSIWNTASRLGYSQFIPVPKHRILDDHIPFLEAGIPAVDIIDIDYPYYHTTQDTLDKVSPESLEAVGETMRVWILDQQTEP